MLEHGGRLRRAAAEYGRPPESWLDLSTGISPWSWIEERGFEPPAASWRRLPEDEDGLDRAAFAYYGAPALPVAGSQAAIQALPRLRPRSRVTVLAPTYAEHARAWQRAGHAVTTVVYADVDSAIEASDVLVLANPNNPDGRLVEAAQLRDWHARLATRGGWLVIDEAFIDAIPSLSLARPQPPPGLVLLRSLGKFFGLAGARVGFVLAEAALVEALAEELGPWPLSGPARAVAAAALADRGWQALQRRRLRHGSERLQTLLQAHGLAPGGGTACFRWVPGAQTLHGRLCREAILVRRFAGGLRLGLPGADAEWRRLDAALRRSARCAA